MQTTAPAAQAKTEQVISEPKPGEFFYRARPGRLGGLSQHGKLFYFGPDDFSALYMPLDGQDRPERFCIFRDQINDGAFLGIELGVFSTVNFHIFLGPNELRELAARLLDAAHDIDTHPPEPRRVQKQKGGAA